MMPVNEDSPLAIPLVVILVPPSRYSRDSGDDGLGDTGIQ